VTPERAGAMMFSEPYLDETLAFVVKDHLRDQFSTWMAIGELKKLRIAVPNLPYYIDQIKRRAPALELALVDTVAQIEAHLKRETFDAVAMPAESGSVLTLLYPKFTVVVPEPRNRQDSTGVSAGRSRSRLGQLHQYMDRAQAPRWHHRRALRPLNSR
jgi:hypothetical protein